VRDRPHLLMLMAEHGLPGQPAPIVKVALGQRADEGTFATINVTDDGHAQVHTGLYNPRQTGVAPR
jgi:hypothetical protein